MNSFLAVGSAEHKGTRHKKCRVGPPRQADFRPLLLEALQLELVLWPQASSPLGVMVTLNCLPKFRGAYSGEERLPQRFCSSGCLAVGREAALAIVHGCA